MAPSRPAMPSEPADEPATSAQRVPRHGATVPRGLVVGSDAALLPGRFGRMFPCACARSCSCDVSDDAIKELLTFIGDPQRNPPSSNNPRIPAGFTYLGQFVDHDITFDPTSTLDGRHDPHALVNFRTPRLDLDSVYGSGPAVQPFLYDWKDSAPPGARLLVGRNPALHPDDPAVTLAAEDLPRNRQGRALIGDARNDENLIVAQLHLLFMRFHNAVVDDLGTRGTGRSCDLFDEAQRAVRWHYQWIVVNEFLPKIVGDPTAQAVLPRVPAGTAAKAHLKHFRCAPDPFIPVEFSGAAYRFGHSMVRAAYGIKRVPSTGPPPHGVTIFPGLEGLTWLPEAVVIDWERFFELPGVPVPPQASGLIDTAIVDPLFHLPDMSPNSLPERNLLRGRALGLPSGQCVARAMGEPELSEQDLKLDDGFSTCVRDELKRTTPLWFYVLCEAALQRDAPPPRPAGIHLGPVGGRIVAEVLVGLLACDSDSYLSVKPDWRPCYGENDDFTMADLIQFATDQPLPASGDG